MVGDHFYLGQADYRREEIPSDSEVKNAAALDVPLPADNASLHSLALSLSKVLPKDGVLPTDLKSAVAWRDAKRARIKEIVHFPSDLDPQPEKLEDETTQGIKVTRWRVTASGWAIPVVELTSATPPPPASKPMRTILLLADEGRSGTTTLGVARDLLSKGHRVLMVDPLLLGESKFPDREYLFALLISTVGERPLGIQAGQIAAVARLAARKPWGDGPASILAIGPRSSVMALVASAVEDASIAEVEIRNPLGSLKELIETNAPYEKSPELFCFGLFEVADLMHLAAACAPRPVRLTDLSKRAQAEFTSLKGWYKTWGIDVD
jgi:hypothetical protein